MFVIAAPGQGSQKPGFLTPWLADESNRDTLDRWSRIVGVDLVAHGTTSDEETIKDTAVAQPLIVAAGILTGRALLAALPDTADLRFAGHSVGEFTACALSGVLSDDEALSLVAVRGRAMADASAQIATGMSAVLGGDDTELRQALDAHGLHAANFNGAGQTVIAGEIPALHAFAQNPPAGTRVIALSVAGAFHTPYMAPAYSALADAAATLTLKDPHAGLYTNRDGSLVDSGDTALSSLVEQVKRPVRWDSCMESFAKHSVQGMMELAPAGALVGLAKRALKGTPTVAINTPDDIALAVEMVSNQ
jgi:[acyl-carrier-protein] S-malonyltransferase